MKGNGNFMKLKVIVLTVIIMFPYLILGQYGFVVDYTDGELVKIELDNPENEIAIGTSMNHLIDAEFGSNNVLYALPRVGTQFYQIDTTTAAINQIGTATPLTGHMWSGLAYDVTTSTLYASSTTGNSASAIYTIDVSTGTASHIGTTTTAQSVADIAFDNSGQMYAHNLSNTIYLIDKTNGSATLLGNTGFNAAGPWHGLDYSFHNNTMYMATYNSITWEKTVRSVNLTTGNTASEGTINHFVGGFAIIHAESPGPGSPEPNITVEPESLIFDTTAVGSSSVDMLSITNTGSDTLLIYNLFSPDSIFSVNLSSFDLFLSESQDVQVTFTPLQQNAYDGDLFIISNDPDTDTLGLPVAGVGFIPAPEIFVDPMSLTFDTTAVGSSTVKLLSITNIGSDTLLIYNLFSPDSIFSVNTDSLNVLPGDDQIVLVTFVPNQPTDYSSDLFIVNNDLETDTLVILLTGVGFIFDPEISVAPIYLAFDTTAAGSSNLKLLTIYNTGNATLTISNISSTESVFSTNLTSYDIQPGDSQMVQVAFTPTEPIIYTSNFFVISNDSEMDTLIVPVSGVGIMLARIELDAQLPHILVLYPNYPNPFNPVTTLRYDLPEKVLVTITIYDMLGRQVKTLMDQTQDAGYRSVIWDATNDYGKPVSAGIYLYQIQAGKYLQTKKMVLLK